MVLTNLRTELDGEKETWLELKHESEMDEVSSLDDESDSSDDESDNDDSDSETEQEPRRRTNPGNLPIALTRRQFNEIYYKGSGPIVNNRSLPDLQQVQSGSRWETVPLRQVTPTISNKLSVDRPPTSLPRLSASNVTALDGSRPMSSGTANARWTSTIRSSNRSSNKLSFDILKDHNTMRASFSRLLSNPDLPKTLKRSAEVQHRQEQHRNTAPSRGVANARWGSESGLGAFHSAPRTSDVLLSNLKLAEQALSGGDRGGVNARWSSGSNNKLHRSTKMSAQLLNALGSSLRAEGADASRESSINNLLSQSHKSVGCPSRWDAGSRAASTSSLLTEQWSTMPRRPRRHAVKLNTPEQRQIEDTEDKDDESVQDTTEVAPSGSNFTGGSSKVGSQVSFRFSHEVGDVSPPVAPLRRKSREATNLGPPSMHKDPSSRSLYGRPTLPERSAGEMLPRPIEHTSKFFDLGDVRYMDTSSHNRRGLMPKRQADTQITKPASKMLRSEESTSNVCIKVVREQG